MRAECMAYLRRAVGNWSVLLPGLRCCGLAQFMRRQHVFYAVQATEQAVLKRRRGFDIWWVPAVHATHVHSCGSVLTIRMVSCQSGMYLQGGPFMDSFTSSRATSAACLQVKAMVATSVRMRCRTG